MQKKTHNINVLPENLINKIAAGEVIDRPAAVVKELIENSIDAGATRIEVILKGGGSQLIQIIDNGSGMSEEDAILSLQRHATSKIRTYADIEKIHTLGFRGEALASMAAVSRLELRTVPAGAISGTLIQVEGGIVQKVEESGGNPGTSIAVKTLFFNTPARRKFLRAESTEYRSILAMLNHFTLAFPEIAFSLVHDDAEVFRLAPAELPERLAEVLGSRVRHNLVPVEDNSALMTVSGYIGTYDVMRKSRNDQYLFLNRRFINDRTLSYAVTQAFGESIPKGHYPLFVLFIEIDPGRVDVNVHPTKNEVKFADSRLVFDLLRSAVKRALRTDHIIPEIQQFYPPRWGAGGAPGRPGSGLEGGPGGVPVSGGEGVNPDEQTTLDWEAGESVFPPPGLFAHGAFAGRTWNPTEPNAATPEAAPGEQSFAPGSWPPGAIPSGPYPPETFPPGSYPPGSYPQGAFPADASGAAGRSTGGALPAGPGPGEPGVIFTAGPESFTPGGTPAPRPREAANVWQVQNKYILSQIKSGLVVIDQHVAHERILYERAKKNISQAEGVSQQLLFPQTIELSPQDYQVMVEIGPWLEKLGFQIKLFGGRTIVVEGVPAGMRVGAENRILLNIIDQYKEYAATETDMRERVAKSFACRSAIMAGEKLS
ncbi:MAG TPA: DNA mismatch repair endonuclease MutL, partial [bacterium]|nr:DNA mismatch repair endonuclease MutL [bacterium]